MVLKLNKKTTSTPIEVVSNWESSQGQSLVSDLKNEFTPSELQVLLEFKRQFPKGAMGYSNALKLAKQRTGIK